MYFHLCICVFLLQDALATNSPRSPPWSAFQVGFEEKRQKFCSSKDFLFGSIQSIQQICTWWYIIFRTIRHEGSCHKISGNRFARLKCTDRMRRKDKNLCSGDPSVLLFWTRVAGFAGWQTNQCKIFHHCILGVGGGVCFILCHSIRLVGCKSTDFSEVKTALWDHFVTLGWSICRLRWITPWSQVVLTSSWKKTRYKTIWSTPLNMILSVISKLRWLNKHWSPSGPDGWHPCLKRIQC